MTCKNRVVFPVAVVCLFLCSAAAHAATITAASCSQTDVQNAINSASSGDAVVVPAGTCSWSTVTILNTKGITLQGASDGTTINGSAALLVQSNGSAGTRVTGFTFTG